MDWNSSALWGIIGLIGGFIVSFIFYKLNIKNKKIVYTKNSQILVTNTLSEIDGLNITYENYPIKDLTSTIITIKSIGKDIINMEDFGKATPFCIKTTEKFFFPQDINTIITKNSNANNLLKLTIKDEATIDLSFDYLSHGDEISLIVLHTGKINIEGKLKKGTLLNKNKFKKFYLSYNNFLQVGSLFFISFYFVHMARLNDEFVLMENISNLCLFLGLGLFLITTFHNLLHDLIISVKLLKSDKSDD